MAPKKNLVSDTVQDDYYANISSNNSTSEAEKEGKKAIKIKKKPVIKKAENPATDSDVTEKKPKIVAKKVTKSEEKNLEAPSVVTKKIAEKPQKKSEPKKDSGEHASQVLLCLVRQKTRQIPKKPNQRQRFLSRRPQLLSRLKIAL